MPRSSVGSGFETKLSAAVTSPGFLIEIAFSTVLRFSTRGDITISGTTWYARPFKVSGPPRPTITITDTDNVIAAYLQTEKIAGKAIKLWKFDGDAPTSLEYTQYFEGEGDDYTINKTSTVIRAVQKGVDTRKEPSMRIVRNSVRQEITKPGTKIYWGTELYTLEN